MFQDSPMTSAEEAANLAWQNYADAHEAVRTAWDMPGIASSNRRALHERMLDAGKRFHAAYDALCQPAPDDDADIVPDVHFEAAFTSDEAVLHVNEVLPSFTQQLTQMFMLLALDRAKMDDFFGRLSEDDALHTLQVCNDTADRANAVSEMALIALHRAIVSAGAKCGMLSAGVAA